jgi:hypothetical protein
MWSIRDQPRKSKDTLTTDISDAANGFGCRSIGPTGVQVPACVLSVALQAYPSNVFCLPHCRRIPAFMLAVSLRGTVSGLLPCFF